MREYLTREIDEALEHFASAYVSAKNWARRNNRSDVHIVKVRYKDVYSNLVRDRWGIEWDDENDRRAYTYYMEGLLEEP